MFTGMVFVTLLGLTCAQNNYNFGYVDPCASQCGDGYDMRMFSDSCQSCSTTECAKATTAEEVEYCNYCDAEWKPCQQAGKNAGTYNNAFEQPACLTWLTCVCKDAPNDPECAEFNRQMSAFAGRRKRSVVRRFHRRH